MCNIPNIDALIHRRTGTYIGKITRTNTNALKQILPSHIQISKQVPLCIWFPLAHDENNWNFFIENYFESCQNADYEDDEPT